MWSSLEGSHSRAMTSTYFEGQAERNPLAQRGHSRDHRPDCKQVCIAMVVTREGMPLGYEVFAGNRTDVTTVEEIVEAMEKRYGIALEGRDRTKLVFGTKTRHRTRHSPPQPPC